MSVATTDYAYGDDAARVRVKAFRAPDAEPPYEDHPPFPRMRPVSALAPWAGAPGLRLVPQPEPDLEDDGAFDAQRTPREQLEDPRPRAGMLVRAFLEALAGIRPVGQLMRWTSPDVFGQLEPLVAARGTRAVANVRKVLVTEPTPGVAEVTAVIQRGPRCGALALRLEGLDGRWLVTALQLG
ncbi:MAG TPA: Rv3235 family protein [Frankiaceae bacterium]|jgi:hypothetical protein|nr:Rv3235 family protein [Frankiaceae bacterium]